MLLGAYLAGYRFDHVVWVSKATFNKGMTGVTTKLRVLTVQVAAASKLALDGGPVDHADLL